MWEIELYESANNRSPVYEFLAELSAKEKAKVIRVIDLLAEFGPALMFPHSRKMEGLPNAGLYELRTKLGSNAFRILYCIVPGDGEEKYLLLHGFRKKTEKTPERELVKARNRRKAYLEERK